jgi:hypothetical protein
VAARNAETGSTGRAWSVGAVRWRKWPRFTRSAAGSSSRLSVECIRIPVSGRSGARCARRKSSASRTIPPCGCTDRLAVVTRSAAAERRTAPGRLTTPDLIDTGRMRRRGALCVSRGVRRRGQQDGRVARWQQLGAAPRPERKRGVLPGGRQWYAPGVVADTAPSIAASLSSHTQQGRRSPRSAPVEQLAPPRR